MEAVDGTIKRVKNQKSNESIGLGFDNFAFYMQI